MNKLKQKWKAAFYKADDGFFSPFCNHYMWILRLDNKFQPQTHKK